MVNFMSQGTLWYLVKHFLGVPVRMFWDEINIWISGLSKAGRLRLPYVAGLHPISWKPEQSQKADPPWSKKVLLPDYTELGHQSSPIPFPMSNWNVGSSWTGFQTGAYTARSPGSPACPLQTLGLLSLQDHVSQFLPINLSLYIHTLLVLFLWRILTNKNIISDLISSLIQRQNMSRGRGGGENVFHIYKRHKKDII